MNKLPVRDIIEWDVSNWAELIPLWTPILNSLNKDIRVLAIGERNGGLSLWLALLGFDVLCTDREGPTVTARKLHEKYGVEQKIQYSSLDIVQPNLQHEQFDLIVAKSVIGGLKGDPTDRRTRNFQIQQQAVNNIYNLLKPGGIYLSAENAQGSQILRLLRRCKGKQKGWRYLNSSEMDLLYNDFSSVNIEMFGFIPGGSQTAGLYRMPFLLNKALNFLPQNMKYIAFATARKPDM